MEIIFLRNEKCESWEKGFKELRLALSEMGVKEEIKEKVLKSKEEVERYGFLGSPTIIINGKDVDMATTELGKVDLDTCRTYLYRGKFYEYPPKEMIIHALEKES